MLTKMKIVGAALLLTLVCGVSLANAAGKPKPELILKYPVGSEKAGTTVPSGTAVEGGWYEVIEEWGCETLADAPTTLTLNSSTKADLAEGVVPPANEVCGNEEEPMTSFSRFAKTHFKRGAKRFAAESKEKVPPLPIENVTFKGSMLTQEMTVKHAGTFGVSSVLVAEGKEGAATCIYEGKGTTLKGEWPAEEDPATADIETEFTFKLKKTGSGTTCAKSEEGYIETWLGPDYHELEADLT